MLIDDGAEANLIDLCDLPLQIFDGASYGEKPETFASFQEAITATEGVLTVVPEYNGSFPGVLKYFVDMLQFPESLYEKPAGFVGISSGPWGAVRAVEQLEMVFQYRHAHLFGRRCFIPGVGRQIGDDGRLGDPDLENRLKKTVLDFRQFCQKLG